MTDLPKFGWITPTKRVIACEPYFHLETFLCDDEIRRILPKAAEWHARLVASYNGSQELIAAGEHPEWHCYEILESDIRSDVYAALLDVGCIRIGTDSTSPCFEGRKEVIADRLEFIRSLCGDLKPEITTF